MTKYLDSAPFMVPPPAKEFRGDAAPLYPDRFPELVDKPSGSSITPEVLSEQFDRAWNTPLPPIIHLSSELVDGPHDFSDGGGGLCRKCGHGIMHRNHAKSFSPHS